MRKMLFAAAIAACAVSVQAIAQPVYVERKQVSPDAARKMVDACLAFAQANNIRVGVAVVDVAGVLIDFHAMPGGGPTMAETAILKAKTAAHWQRSTGELEEDVANRAIEQLALFGQDQAARVAMEQRSAQRVLERADLAAYRGLAQIERVAGMREAACLGDRMKYAELVPVHRA